MTSAGLHPEARFLSYGPIHILRDDCRMTLNGGP
ncbi:hypothetical protein GGE65_005554 [Skermanella aerolata]